MPHSWPREVYQTEAEKVGLAARWDKPSGSGWPADYDQSNDEPVVEVSWNDGMKLCEWLSTKEMKTYQLLTEAQWECACRAGTQTAYSFGDDPKDLSDYAWYFGNSESHTHPAGGKRPNSWGLYDMQGNVYGWCQDYYNAYSGAEEKNPIHVVKDSVGDRVLRGGCWSLVGGYCRAASRYGIPSGSCLSNCGLRVCFRLD